MRSRLFASVGVFLCISLLVNTLLFANVYGITIELEKEFTVFGIDTITICRPNNWDELSWGQVLMRGEELRIKAVLTPHGNPDKIDTFEVIVKTSITNPDGIIVTLTETGKNTNELKGTTSTTSLIPSGNDSVTSEFASGDDTDSGDSVAFENRYGGNTSTQFRGGARNPGNEAAQIPADTVSFFRSAGIEELTVEGSNNKKDVCLIQNQADIFYISSHGYSADYGVWEGSFDASNGDESVWPSTIGSSWNEDVDIIIFATCSILDINNSSGQIENPSNSPGKDWWEHRGTATVLYGYSYSAPSSPMDKIIIEQWDGTPEGWMKTNINYPDCDRNPFSVVITNDEYWYWEYNIEDETWEIIKLSRSQWGSGD